MNLQSFRFRASTQGTMQQVLITDLAHPYGTFESISQPVLKAAADE